MSDLLYYVTIRNEGAEIPVYRSPMLSREGAKTLMKRKRKEVINLGYRHKVEAFFRNGANVTKDLEADGD